MKNVKSNLFANLENDTLTSEKMTSVLGGTIKPGPWESTAKGIGYPDADTARANQGVPGGIERDVPSARN